MEVPGRKAVYCDPCNEYDQTFNDSIEGFCEDCSHYLCTDCYRIHRRPKPWRNHRLLDRSNMPKIRPEKVYEDECEEECPDHTKKFIEYFCEDHQLLGCSVCMTLNHKACVVDYIPNVCGAFVNSQEYKMFETNIQELMKKLDELHAKKKRKSLEAKETVERSIIDINGIMGDLETLQNLLKIELVQLKKKKSTDEEYYEEVIPKIGEMKASLDHLKNDVTVKTLKKQHCSLYTTIKRNQGMEVGIKARLGDMDVDLVPYTFDQLETCVNMLKYCCMRLANINTEKDSQKHKSQWTAECSHGIIPRKVAELNASLENDSEPCEITALVKLTDTKLAIADKKNGCVKILDIKTNEVISSRDLSSSPCDMTLAQSNLAITTPLKGAISIITIEGLRWVRGILVGAGCRGIVYHDKRLFVSFSTMPACVKEINMHGQILNTIRADRHVRFSSNSVLALHADSDSLYVSCTDTKQIVCMTPRWLFLRRHQNNAYNGITSLAVSRDRIVFLCDKGGNTVHVLDSTLQHVLTRLGESHGLTSPHGMAYSDTDDTLYVAMGNTIKAFRMFMFSYKKSIE